MSEYISIPISTIDYYPFGQEMPGRYFARHKYRFGFNGKQYDNDIADSACWQDYGMRENDTRICRFISVDPLTKSYPWYSPYQFAGNKPIWAIDLDGLEERLYHSKFKNEECKTIVKIVDNTKLGKEFKEKLDAQNKIDVYYFPMEPYYGEKGITRLVNNEKEFVKLKDKWYYQNANLNDVKNSFSKGKKILMIGIDEVKIKSTEDIVESASTVHHEEGAHGINILDGKSSTIALDHEKYNNWKNYASPTTQEIETKPKFKKSPAFKGLKEIRKYVKKNRPLIEY